MSNNCQNSRSFEKCCQSGRCDLEWRISIIGIYNCYSFLFVF